MAHKKCIRVDISPLSFNYLRISIWKRQGIEGGISEMHPTIDMAISEFNKYSKNQN